MKITHLINTSLKYTEMKCYCGKNMLWRSQNWTTDARRTNCKGAMRVIKAGWDIFLNHEARRKK